MTLTAEERTLLRGLAEPIAYDQREAFLAAVAEALANYPHRGPGSVSDRGDDPGGVRPHVGQ